MTAPTVVSQDPDHSSAASAEAETGHAGGTGRPAGHRGRRLLAAALGPVVVAGLLGAAAFRFLRDPEPPAGVAVPAITGDVIGGLEAAVNARPDDVQAWQQLGAAYLAQGIDTGDPSFYGQARSAYDRAEALLPGNPTTAVGLATLDLALHRFEDARARGLALLAANPLDPDALAVVIDAEVELGRYDEAAAHTQQLLDVRPGLAALTRTSYQRELRGDLDGALTAMVQAEVAGGGGDTLGPSGDARPRRSVATVIALQGDVLWAGGDTDGAAARYRRALELAPELTVAELGLARTDAASGRLDAAIDRLQALVDRAPALGAATLLADLQLLAGTEPTADALVDVIAQLERTSGAVVDLELATHLADRGRPDVDLARATYEARPSIYGADALAWSLLRAGRAAEAVPFTEESLRLGSRDALLHLHAAMVFDAAGDRDRAAAELQQALDTNPWPSFGLHGETVELAARLGVPAPDAWEGPR